uniref:Thioredoxin domain-containing protein n=1 Tax=Alexandrium monilatum TaxID=311494 RepID=A0A7S4R8T5_9DINO|mmetsp:Transcript_61767/g.184003  ORF Transcript_61767/g.184003 Transcript_61767/m.184003 type:complete len:248 (-) Transcript_61767:101-844(-)
MPAGATPWFIVTTALLSCSLAASGQEAVVSTRFEPVVPLNRRTFGGNVLTGDRVDHWMVLFCVDWYEPCEELFGTYLGLAEEHNKALNGGSVLRDVVRFASVDCAVDKVLCNEQLVDNYPTVVHYKGGVRVKAWTGKPAKLAKWLGKELPSSTDGAAVATAPLLSEEERTLVMRLVASFAAFIALFIWAVGQGADLWLTYTATRSQQHPAKPSKQESTPDSGAAGSGGRLVRRLPQDWARERGSVVL